MKTKILFMLTFISFNYSFSQNLSDKLNKTNRDLNNTTNSIENSVNTTDKLINTGKNIFGNKKKIDDQKNTTNPNSINTDNKIIHIKNIEYDNPNFSLLFQKIKTYKGVTVSKKAFENREGIISFNFKGDVTEIWDSFDENIHQKFKIEKISADTIKISLKKQS